MEQRTVIYKSRKKAAVIAISGLLLGSIACLFFFYMNDSIFGWIFVICAAMILILGIGSYFDRRPQVILSDSGITDLTTIREEIEWSHILHADDFWYRGQDFVRLLVPVGYKDGLLRPGWFCRLDRMYAKDGVRAFYIRISGLDINSVTLVRLIKRRLADENSA